MALGRPNYSYAAIVLTLIAAFLVGMGIYRRTARQPDEQITAEMLQRADSIAEAKEQATIRAELRHDSIRHAKRMKKEAEKKAASRRVPPSRKFLDEKVRPK